MKESLIAAIANFFSFQSVSVRCAAERDGSLTSVPHPTKPDPPQKDRQSISKCRVKLLSAGGWMKWGGGGSVVWWTKLRLSFFYSSSIFLQEQQQTCAKLP